MILLLSNFLLLIAQGPSVHPPPPNYGTDGQQLPIDGGIWILVIAAVVLGIYSLYKKRKAINKAS